MKLEQLEQLEELLKLKRDNPDLEIVYMVNYEVCAGDDFRYWLAFVEKIKKGIYYVNKDSDLYQVITDYDELYDYVACYIEDSEKTEEENRKMIEEEIKKFDIKEAIIIYLGL